MDDFKNSTKTQYAKGGSAGGPRGAAKVAKVMGAFKHGALYGGAQQPLKKAGGGRVDGTSSRPRDARGRELSNSDIRKANRDVGGLSAAEMQATRERVARGNRAPRERIPTDAEAARMMSPYKKGGSVKPFNAKPLAGKGGLSAMPPGKKR